MDSARSGTLCRRFINGSCRFGPRCNYRHERLTVPSGQICRYFQKGGCKYGERCRYLHVLQPEVDTGVAGRRGSVPIVSSGVAHATPDRRGSVPALLQTDVTSRLECRRSESVANASDQQHINTNSSLTNSQTSSRELGQSSDMNQAAASDGRNEQDTSSAETTENGAAAAASRALEKVEEKEAFLQSKNVTCGICMDKVYEKTDPRNHVFGILPNCNHSFCLQCIMTWRKTRDLGLDVVKSCPQCRVKSGFYVPNKYWVEGQAKEGVIAAFKEKFSKKSCSYYARYRRCPFKTDCLYRHDKPVYDGLNLLNFFIAMSLFDEDDDDEDDFDFPFYLSEEYGF
uniref:RING-type E3 ubiquitin transferase n=1 Tax=Mastacembelus armatus TaxID=205130 RepID=A0A3Q3M4Z6_9TELE